MPHTIAIAGAHTALARALVELLREREIEAELVLAAPHEHLIEDRVPLSSELFDRADLGVVAAAGPVYAALAERGRSAGRPILDLAGVVPRALRRWTWPLLDPDAGRQAAGAASIAVGLAGPVVAVLRALDPLEPRRAWIATYESAALLDQVGIDALQEEARAIFTLKEPPELPFGERLAFNVLPGPPRVDPAAAEAELAEPIGAGALRPIELSIARAIVSTFSAEAAAIELEVAAPAEGPSVDRAQVIALLKAARGLMVDPGPGVSAAAASERDDTVVSRVAAERGRVSLWVSVDRLRGGGAAPAALFIEQWLAERSA